MPMPWQLRRGERRNCKRPLFEDMLCLDARWLARKKLIPKDYSTRRYGFSFVIPPIAALTLASRTAKILTCDGREQTVAIHWQCNGGSGHGSMRPMFVCQCGYGAFRLFDCFGAIDAQSLSALATLPNRSHAKAANTCKASACAASWANIQALARQSASRC